MYRREYEDPMYSKGYEGLEIIHGDPPMPVIWTVDDEVLASLTDKDHDEPTTVFLGHLPYETDDAEDDNLSYKIQRLRLFVSAWRKNTNLGRA
jgi:hypothetical protein